MKLSEMEKTDCSPKEQDLKENLEKLQGLSQEELMKRLLSEVALQKSQGKFDYEGLRQTVENMRRYMPDELYQNILQTLESLK